MSKSQSNERKIPKSTFELYEPSLGPPIITSQTVIHPPASPYQDQGHADIESYRKKLEKKAREGDLGDILKHNQIFGQGKIKIPVDGGYEPTWRPGRDPEGGGKKGKGKKGSEGDGNPEFVEIDPSEFLQMRYGDLELPDMKRKQTTTSESVIDKRRGTQRRGPKKRLDRKATAKERIKRALSHKQAHPEQFADNDPQAVPGTDKVPYIKGDRRYFRLQQKPVPDTKAVVVFMLDVSGSTQGKPLEILKNFFWLVYLFVQKKYGKNVEVVMVAHTDGAYIVKTAKAFFELNDNGGTKFSKAYELIYKLLRKLYPAPEWNVYLAQGSDGDIFDDDAPEIPLWISRLFDMCGMNYMFYLQVDPYAGSNGVAYKIIDSMPAKYRQQIALGRVMDPSALDNVIRHMFKPKSKS